MLQRASQTSDRFSEKISDLGYKDHYQGGGGKGELIIHDLLFDKETERFEQTVKDGLGPFNSSNFHINSLNNNVVTSSQSYSMGLKEPS